MKFYRLQDGKVFEIKQDQFDELEDLIVFDESYEPVPSDWYSDGDSFADGIFLFFGDTIIKVADSKEEFLKFLDHLDSIKEQLEEY